MKKEVYWDQVKRLAKKKGITQVSLAKACNVPISTFKGWINKNYFPTVIDGYIIAVELGVTVEYLVTGKERPGKREINNIRRMLQRVDKKLEDIP